MLKKSVEACVKANMPVLLMGETGVGKTTFVRQIAKADKKDLLRININGETTREDLVGKFLLKNGETVWTDGLLIRAMKTGKWLLLDEINAALPEVLLVLQSVLESENKKLGTLTLTEDKGQVVTPHKDFRIFATCNPPHYVGVKEINDATLSRFVVFHYQPFTNEEEMKALTKQFPKVDKVELQSIQLAAGMLRNLFEQRKVGRYTSLRELIQCSQLIAHGVDRTVAIKVAFLNKFILEQERETAMNALKELEGLDVNKLLETVQIGEGLLHTLVAKSGDVEAMFKDFDKVRKGLKAVSEKYGA